MPAAALDASRAAQQRMAFVLSLRERGISDVAVLRALETIPREIFVPHHFADLAWRDIALPIACGQTMPQPFLVARMMMALELEPGMRVCEVGTGSGYAAAILSRLAGEVYSCERFRSLARAAQERFEAIGAGNVTARWADGLDLSGEAGVFDRVLVQASIGDVPRTLITALRPGGLVMFPRLERGGQPAGFYSLRRTGSGVIEDFLFAGRFAAAISGRSREL